MLAVFWPALLASAVLIGTVLSAPPAPPAEENKPLILTFKELQTHLAKEKGKLVVVNFWATWCKPCVAELPHFERMNEAYRDKNLKIILVSNDFTSEFETRLTPFVRQKKMKCEVVGLNESDPNKWINEIDPEWSGSLPFTIVYDKNGKKVAVHNGSLNYDELEKMVKPYL